MHSCRSKANLTINSSYLISHDHTPPLFALVLLLVDRRRNSALALLEWLGDEAAEGRGENILDVEVLWTPADPDDSLDRDDLDAKWPELIRL